MSVNTAFTQPLIVPNATTNPQLRGPWLTLARAVWVGLVGLSIILFILSIPFSFADWRIPCNAENCFQRLGAISVSQAAELESWGLTTDTYAGFEVALQTILMAASVAIAIIIYQQRSDDWASLALSAMLVTYGAYNTLMVQVVAQHVSWLVIPVEIVTTAGFALFWTALYYFPNGRFIPGWTIIVIPIALVSIAYGLIVPTSRYLPGNPRIEPFQVYVFGILIGVLAQAYRYLRADPLLRRQSAWVLAGFAGLVIGRIVLFPMLRILFPVQFLYEMPIIGIIIQNLGFNLTGLLVPIAFGIAITRYRLWEIDFLLNRTLVYAMLTAILGSLFALGFFAINGVLSAVFNAGSPLVSIGLPALAVAAIFRPTQTTVRRFIDRRFGIKLDYVEAVKAYGGSRKEPRRTGGTKASFGQYSDLSLVGRGGMGEVYLAQHPTLHRSVAIKILPPHAEADDDAHKRFDREAQTVAGLKHPNIVTLHDVGKQDGQPYMVMEFVDGPDLSTVLKQRGRLPLNEAVPILRDIAAALDYAHSQGVVHRDIKPSNVMVEPITATESQSDQTRTNRAVLMDFGIAKSYAAGTRLTQSGMIGTLDYISPEQIQGASEVDGRADIYSFGVMAYQVLTGEVPFKHSNPGAMVMAHLMQPPPDPRQSAPDLPQEASDAVMRAMAKKPEQRFATAGEFVAALE